MVEGLQTIEDALAAHQSGQVDVARRFYRRLIAFEPSRADALHLEGLAEYQIGASDVALVSIRAALTLEPESVLFATNLMTVLKETADRALQQGRATQAAATYRRLLQTSWDDSAARGNLAVALDRSGAPDALVEYRRAISVGPASPEALGNFADRLYRDSCWKLAALTARRAATIEHTVAAPHMTAGASAFRSGQLTPALRSYKRALTLEPAATGALSGLATVQMDQGDMIAAGRSLGRAKVVDPDDVPTNCNLGTWHLLRGDLAKGLPYYEWRWRRPDGPRKPVGPPTWKGDDPSGKSIRVFFEQGLGDAIQAVRFVPALSSLGARVWLESPDPLRRLLTRVPGVERLLEPRDSGETADLQIAAMSLPLVFGANLASLPSTVPYLSVEPALAMRWREQLKTNDPRLKIGIVWQGNPAQFSEPGRSVPLSELLPVLRMPECHFYSLQKEHGLDQLRRLPDDIRMVDLAPQLHDMADTAAAILNLDLVVTTCTSVAHLAGALGRPVWILLRHVPDWRWMLNRSDSPWYPTAKLLRQHRPGDWTIPIAEVRAALVDLQMNVTSP